VIVVRDGGEQLQFAVGGDQRVERQRQLSRPPDLSSIHEGTIVRLPTGSILERSRS